MCNFGPSRCGGDADIASGGGQAHRHSFFPRAVAIAAVDRPEAGLFKKYNLDFDLVFIASSPSVAAAMLSGDAEVRSLDGRGLR